MDGFSGNNVRDVFRPEIDHVDVAVAVKRLGLRGGFERNSERNQQGSGNNGERRGEGFHVRGLVFPELKH